MYIKKNFDTFTIYKKIFYRIFKQETVMQKIGKLSTQILESPVNFLIWACQLERKLQVALVCHRCVCILKSTKSRNILGISHYIQCSYRMPRIYTE